MMIIIIMIMMMIIMIIPEIKHIGKISLTNIVLMIIKIFIHKIKKERERERERERLLSSRLHIRDPPTLLMVHVLI